MYCIVPTNIPTHTVIFHTVAKSSGVIFIAASGFLGLKSALLMTTEEYLIFYNYTYSLISTNNNKLVKSLQKIIFSGYYFLANCMTWDKKKTLRFNANPMTRFEDYAAHAIVD